MIFRLSLRALGLGAKFILTLAIAHYLGYRELGLYGVVIAASIIVSKFFSVGFSSEVNRLISVDGSSLSLINKVLVVYFLVGLGASLVAVSIYSLFHAEAYTLSVIICVVLVIFSEHISFEVNSFVFSAHEFNLGAVLFFLKTGLWAIISSLGLFVGVVDGLEVILWLWFVSNITVIVVGYSALTKLHCDRKHAEISMLSIWREGIPFYSGAIFLAAAQYVERFIIMTFDSYEKLGVYIYSWSIANTLQTVSYAVVAVVALPKIAKEFNGQSSGLTCFKLFCNKWVASSLALSFFLALSIYVMFFYLFDIFGVSISKPDISVFSVLLLAFSLRGVADLVWGSLIASKNRKISVVSPMVCLIISFPVYYMLIDNYSIYGAAWGSVCSVVVQLSTVAMLVKYSSLKA